MDGICTPCLNAQWGSNAWMRSTHAFKDMDSDGDLDMFLSNNYYFENVGNSTSPKFVERIGADNPLNGLVEQLTAAMALVLPDDLFILPLRDGVPALEDIDGDGDYDLFFGTADLSHPSMRGQYIVYFENIGNSTNSNFSVRTDLRAPMYGINVAGDSQPRGGASPALIDIDHDGDFDMFVGVSAGKIHYFENIGNTTTPIFVQRIGSANPLNTLVVSQGMGDSATSTFEDFDNDGDFDMFVGETGGTLLFYENTGSATNAAFTARTGTQNPMNGIDVVYSAHPDLVDLDGDGDFDMVVGSWDNTHGKIYYFENIDALKNPTFTPETGSQNILNDIVIFSSEGHRDAQPLFVDLDDDGDQDMVISTGVDILYYKNIGTSSVNPIFNLTAGSENPLNDFVAHDFNGVATNFCQLSLAFYDLDGDLDYDMSVGCAGRIKYYENIGSRNTPKFTESSFNPMGSINFGRSGQKYSINLAIGDIDNDGDGDLFVGGRDLLSISMYPIYKIHYYENTGSPTVPAFTQRTGKNNPMNGINPGNRAKPVLHDLDKDGDFDMIVSAVSAGNLLYFENKGNSSSPNFIERLGADNPMNGVIMNRGAITGSAGRPSFFDANGDGNIDLFLSGRGQVDIDGDGRTEVLHAGKIAYFERNICNKDNYCNSRGTCQYSSQSQQSTCQCNSIFAGAHCQSCAPGTIESMFVGGFSLIDPQAPECGKFLHMYM